MKKMFLVFIAFTLSAGAVYAQNFEGPYIGGTVGYNSYSLGNFTSVGGSSDENMSGATFGGIFGVRSEVADDIIVGIEGFLNANTANKSFTFNNSGTTLTRRLDADISYGFDATVGIRNDQTLLFAMAGYGWNKITSETTGVANSTTFSNGNGIRLGAGAEMIVTDQVSLRVQANWQDFAGGTSAIGGAIGAIFNF